MSCFCINTSPISDSIRHNSIVTVRYLTSIHLTRETIQNCITLDYLDSVLRSITETGSASPEELDEVLVKEDGVDNRGSLVTK